MSEFHFFLGSNGYKGGTILRFVTSQVFHQNIFSQNLSGSDGSLGCHINHISVWWYTVATLYSILQTGWTSSLRIYRLRLFADTCHWICQCYIKDGHVVKHYIHRSTNRMADDSDLTVESSACNICTEDMDAALLVPAVTDVEKKLFGGEVDFDQICMYSLLHARFLTKTYDREVVALHEIVPGPVVKRYWLHKDTYDDWLPYMSRGQQAGLCPGCNRGLLLDYNNTLVLYNKDDVNARTPCGANRNLTSLYIAVEAKHDTVVTYLLKMEHPEVEVDGTSEIFTEICTPLQCAIKRGYWRITGFLLAAGACNDFKLSSWLGRNNDVLCFVAKSRQGSILRHILLHVKICPFYTLSLMMSCMIENVPVVQSSHRQSIIAYAALCGTWEILRENFTSGWDIVRTMLELWNDIWYENQMGIVWSPPGNFTIAAQHNLIQIAGERLLSCDEFQNTILYYAIRHAEWDIVEKVLEVNLRVNDNKCKGDIKLLRVAAQDANYAIVAKMLSFPNIITSMKQSMQTDLALNQEMVIAACKAGAWILVVNLFDIVYPAFLCTGDQSPFLIAAESHKWNALCAMIRFTFDRLDDVVLTSESHENVAEIMAARRKILLQKDIHAWAAKVYGPFLAECHQWPIVWNLLTKLDADPNTKSGLTSLFSTVIVYNEWPLAEYLSCRITEAIGNMTPKDLALNVHTLACMQQWKLVAIWVQAGPPLRKEDMLPLLTQASAGGAGDVVFWILRKEPIRPNVVFINEMAAVAREQQELYMLGILHT